MVSVAWHAYADGQVAVMHPDTFEQVNVSPALFGAQRSLMREGMNITLNILNGEVVSGAVVLVQLQTGIFAGG